MSYDDLLLRAIEGIPDKPKRKSAITRIFMIDTRSHERPSPLELKITILNSFAGIAYAGIKKIILSDWVVDRLDPRATSNLLGMFPGKLVMAKDMMENPQELRWTIELNPGYKFPDGRGGNFVD